MGRTQLTAKKDEGRGGGGKLGKGQISPEISSKNRGVKLIQLLDRFNKANVSSKMSFSLDIKN